MFAYDKPAEDAAVVARLLNDHIAGVVAARPGPLRRPRDDPAPGRGYWRSRSWSDASRSSGLAGVQIGTHVGDRDLDDPAIEAVLAAADSLGAAVFVHPWDMLSPERMTRHWLPWLVGMPAELALAIASVVLGGVLDRHPSLRLLFAHGGGAFPGLLGRVEAGFHARPDLAATATSAEPRETVRRIYVDSLTHDPDTLRFVAGIVGEDRIALGTDYPFPLGEAGRAPRSRPCPSWRPRRATGC